MRKQNILFHAKQLISRFVPKAKQAVENAANSSKKLLPNVEKFYDDRDSNQTAILKYG
jgi:hypothetical protein